MRFLHFSDVHLEDGFREVPWRRFLNKRFVGYANLFLRRRKYYARAPQKLARLAEFMEAIDVDVALCSGDYTALGTAPELAHARAIVRPFEAAPGGFVTVPGNHDVYLPDALEVFEAHFGDLLVNDLPELAADGVWPLVRLFGEHVAVVCVNSSRPNPPVFRSSGRVPDAQLAALERVFTHPKVAGRFVFVMTHYAPRLASGRPDTPQHGLENADALLAATARLERGAIVHGHVHKCFALRVPETGVPLCGAGSTTMEGREGLWIYDVEPDGAWITRGRWEGESWRLDEGSRIPLADRLKRPREPVWILHGRDHFTLAFTNPQY